VTAVFPSEDDDVVTSPYNSVLALQQLTEFADCVLPIENQVGILKPKIFSYNLKESSLDPHHVYNFNICFIKMQMSCHTLT